MYEHGMIAPVMALVLWSLLVWAWMYATRIPAMRKAKVEPQKGAMAGALKTHLPDSANKIADNYNHLMEQPTIFYATAFAAQFIGAADGVNMGLAWAYVVMRVAHSLIQNTANVVMARFLVFSLSTVTLAILAIRVVLAL